jgi:putative ABC transport system permease protein
LTVVGLNDEGLEIRNFEIEHGRRFSALESDRGARVVVLGAEAKTRLFGRRDAVGEWIRAEGLPLQVVGVAKRKGDQLMYMGDADDNQVLIPARTAVRWLARDDVVGRFISTPRTRHETDHAIQAIRSLTSIHHRFAPDDDMAMDFVGVHATYQILDLLFGALRFFLVGVGIVTLRVGAIGVLNMWLVMVGERVQEIGLRKALGASNRAIFRLFLCESMAVSSLAGLGGAALGWLLVELTRAAIDSENSRLSRPEFDAPMTATIVVALILTGLLAGVLPALRAARIAPAESLRAH